MRVVVDTGESYWRTVGRCNRPEGAHAGASWDFPTADGGAVRFRFLAAPDPSPFRRQGYELVLVAPRIGPELA